MAQYAKCPGCGTELPAWHINGNTCIDCAPDSDAQFAALDSLNNLRDDIRAGVAR